MAMEAGFCLYDSPMVTLHKVLVTGATGSLGRVLVELLARVQGVEVYTTSRSPDGPAGSLRHVPGDLRNGEDVRRVLRETSPQTVIHLAALTGVDCESDPLLAHEVNVVATRSLAVAASEHGVRRFVFASSAAVYGDEYDQPAGETNELAGRSEYGKTKIAAERALISSRENLGLDVVILRVFNIYGEGFANSLVERLRHASPTTPVTLFGSDNYVRDYIHGDDVARAFATAAMLRGDQPLVVVNVGTGQAVSNAQLLSALGSRREHVTIRDGQPSFSQADITAMTRLLGLTPRGFPTSI